MNYGIDWEAEQRQTLLGTRATLDRAAQSVARSQTVAAETEQIGQEVIAELGVQRETLIRTRRRLSETDQELAASRKIMRLIGRRVLTNKIVLILIIISEAAILGLTIYLKFFSKK
ncbi:vesicle transport through interaction with t-SNAREs homolog 1B [Cotesia glomerata]|uniref:vesicle transport through interaction with t-SNAREs homolog 1B n=1 Tax=Cotesia glomerata TaxID=32391 RepID=UPI001D031D44|nr:vesicle transport through interaction with t-SNAREs homolog 1B [Cotesia glomerata]XP_044574521.1 vesicle transport through interaction with t-SNAREs homolog 1B [Cotesia glomerata]